MCCNGDSQSTHCEDTICTVCNLGFNGPKQYRDHLALSRKHMKLVLENEGWLIIQNKKEREERDWIILRTR